MAFTFRYLFIITIFLQATRLQAQGKDYADALQLMHLKEYTVTTATDTIYFLATDPGKKKKTIILCQGSGPVPLVIHLAQGLCSPFPFATDSTARKAFNLVIISKPGLKRYATEADLDKTSLRHGQMLQLDSLNRPPQKYMADNSIYKLGGDCISVIRFLKKQSWVDKDNIYVFGHSQGADVAAYVAWKDAADVKGLIFSQSNAYGVYAGYLSKLLYSGDPSASDVTAKMDSLYHQQRSLLAGDSNNDLYRSLAAWNSLPPTLTDEKNNDFYDAFTSRWRSLDEPPAIDYLLKINCPILLLNGLASPGEYDNKNIPLDFNRHNKHNLTARFYPGYDHNFFKSITDEKGNPKEPEFHWDDVFNDVKSWIREIK